MMTWHMSFIEIVMKTLSQLADAISTDHPKAKQAGYKRY